MAVLLRPIQEMIDYYLSIYFYQINYNEKHKISGLKIVREKTDQVTQHFIFI